jgi:thiol:disulfide interchange protein DsbA
MEEEFSDTAEFIHTPAPLNRVWANHARLYYLIESFDLGWKAHESAYRAVIEGNGKALGSRAEIVEFLLGYGLDEMEVAQRFSSDSIIDNVKSDYLRMKAYGVGVTPSLVIDGTQLIDGYTAGGVDSVLGVAETLLEN